MDFKLYNDVDSPTVSTAWKNLNNEERLQQIKNVIQKSKYVNFFTVTRITDSGSVYLNFLSEISSNIRGNLLLDLEAKLKSEIDNGLTIWCEPLGDRSSLRKLRGIQIKDGSEF